MITTSNIVLAVSILTAPAHAFFRMPVGQLVKERIDPVISPGVVAGHVHQVGGGNGFGFTETYEDARKGTCTTAEAQADMSNYWTPMMFYQDRNGSFVQVPQDGMTVYYQQRGPDPSTLKAFPEGFRMVAGNPFKRNSTSDFASQAVSHVCLDYDGGSDAGQFAMLPTHACKTGVRSQIYFPSCWDGRLDSDDHTSHMSYPASGNYDNGPCPSSHPTQLVSIFYEVIFGTSGFDFWEGTSGTGHPFVLSNGDPTGYGFHGDFVNGWDVDILQKAVSNCNNDSGTMEDCHELTLVSDDDRKKCSIPTSVNEDIVGPMAQLPGCNPLTAGPAPAVPQTNCAKTPISGPQVPFTDVTAKGWAYQGCATDDVNARTLTGTNNIYSADQATMTVDACVDSCKGSTYAGIEYGGQCFCGNSVASDRAPQPNAIGSCNMPCKGNATQFCGGAAQLSLYKTCSGADCTNVGYVSVGDLTGAGGSGTGTAAASSASAPAATSGSAGSASGSSAAASTSSVAKVTPVPMGASPATDGTVPAQSQATSSTSAVAAATTGDDKQAGSASVAPAALPTTTLIGSSPDGYGDVTVTVDHTVYVTVVRTVTAGAKVAVATSAGHKHGHSKRAVYM